MDSRVSEILRQYLSMNESEMEQENREALDGEITMCPDCIAKTDEAIASMIAVLEDATISKGMRFGFVIAAAADALSQSAHGRMPVSEIFGTMYGCARAKEAAEQVEGIMHMIFGDPESNKN